MLFLTPFLSAYKIMYAEQYYKLYHTHLIQYPDDTMENIWYLEQALKADFCNPLNALAKIETKEQWKKYRCLFTMHVHLKLIELYLALGTKYNKFHAYFYNYPWKQSNLDSLKKAEEVYEFAKVFWKQAVQWSKKAQEAGSFRFEELQLWHDEQYRIETRDLDYETIINKHLEKLRKVRQEFQKMHPGTY